MDDMIDEAVAEVVDEGQTVTDHTTDENQENDQATQDDSQDEVSEEEKWPDKAQNALNRHKRQSRTWKARAHQAEQKLRQQAEAFEARLAKLETPAPKEPSPDDFDNYEDFLMAKFAHQQGSQKEKPQDKPLSQEEIFRQAQEQIHYQQKTQAMGVKAAQAAKDIPEYAQLASEYADILEDMPEGTVKAFMDLENAPAAFYALAKDGAIEGLATLPPMVAATILGRAEVKGEQMMKALKSQQTKAPPPMKGVKGMSAGAIDPLDMSEAEFQKKYL